MSDDPIVEPEEDVKAPLTGMFRGEIDVAHAKLIDGLVRAFKPVNILEFGFGGGRSHNAIAMGALFNANQPKYTLVDSWLDNGGTPPDDLHLSVNRHSLNHKHHDRTANTFSHFAVVTSQESDFVRKACSDPDRYDFIMSDADHQHTHEWCGEVYTHMLASPGLLIYHDVNGAYPGLANVEGWLKARGAQTMVFNKNTREEEHCDRGLLVVYKP